MFTVYFSWHWLCFWRGEVSHDHSYCPMSFPLLVKFFSVILAGELAFKNFLQPPPLICLAFCLFLPTCGLMPLAPLTILM